MALDPITLLTIAALLLGTMGTLLIRSSRGVDACVALREWGLGLVASAIGLSMILLAPTDVTSPVRVLGNAALLFGFGLVWAAARRLGRGAPPRPTAAAAGALVWLAMILAAAPSLGWRIGVSSTIISIYSFAAASELTRDRSRPNDARRRGAMVLAVHGGFYALRALFGPTFGFAAWRADLSKGWGGGALGLETMLFAVLFGALAIAMSRERAAQTLRQDALEDTLTGVGNRRALADSGAALLAEAAASCRPLAILMMDLDGFKHVNDGSGHAAGDRLLRAFARSAHDYLPPTSLVCRLGGDEFVALLPGASPERARAVADELRALFAHVELTGAEGPVAATVSIGIAQAGVGRNTLAELLGVADRCLYAAKNAGRDRVVHEADLAEDDVSSVGRGGRESAPGGSANAWPIAAPNPFGRVAAAGEGV